MKRLAWIALALAALGCDQGSDTYSAGSEARDEFEGLRLEAADGKTVFAELVKTERIESGVVLMFHQAGSNMHEYDPIAIDINSLGWDCLKVDLRSGGDQWGEINLTMSQFSENQQFLDAYQDIEAALAWAEGEEYEKIIAWGSSYTASFVLKLASENESVDAAMAFSPGEYKRLYPEGEYTEEGTLVGDWNAAVTVPVFFSGTGDEREAIYLIKDSSPDTEIRNHDIVQTSAKGLHGSSTLRQDKNPEGYGWFWDAVELFLEDIESDGKAFGG